MQSTSVDDQHRDGASLVPEWPTTMEARSSGFNNDHRERQAIDCQATFCS